MTKQPAFCVRCGLATVTENTGYFDAKTGREVTEQVCPNACAHGYHLMVSRVPRRLFQSPMVCKRCGIGMGYEFD